MKSILLIILIFVLMQALGLYIGQKYISVLDQAIETGEIDEKPGVIPGVSPDSAENSLFLFGYMLFTTLIILALIRFRKSSLRIVEGLVVFSSSWVAFSLLIPFSIQIAWENALYPILSPLDVLGFVIFNVLTLNTLFAIALTVWKVKRPTILSQNVAAIISGSGAGSIIGVSLGIVPSILFMMILSVYDFVSVFITKHMVKMAKAVTERPMAFTIAAPHKFKNAKYIPTKGSKKKVHVFQLGLGDVIIPMMFSVSILGRFTILHSIFSVAGSLIALVILSIIITRKPMALPALPFVCSGSLAGYIVSLMVL